MSNIIPQFELIFHPLLTEMNKLVSPRAFIQVLSVASMSLLGYVVMCANLVNFKYQGI